MMSTAEYKAIYDALLVQRRAAEEAESKATAEVAAVQEELVDLVRDAVQEHGFGVEDCARVFGQFGAAFYYRTKAL